jgi:predicted MPP superfamily phosphohydrolase
VEVSTLERKKKAHLSRRDFLKLGGIAAVGLPLYAGEISRHEINIERISITLPNLPEAFRGFTIAQISDFHYAEYTEAFFLRRVVERVNSLKPDMVALTGDFITTGFWSVDDTVRFAGECAEILSLLQSPLRYAVLGNHDCAVKQYKQAVNDELQSQGIPVLNNRSLPIERSGARIWLAGTGDALCGDFGLERALPAPPTRDGEALILLAHEPDVLPLVAGHNVDLMLSGHTHGGQVRFPFLPAMFLPELGQHYIEGLYRLGPTQLYVNRGVGTVNLPFRFNCPPEITLITLA